MAVVASDAVKQWSGYSEDHNSGGKTVTEVFTCPWSDRDTVQSSFIGAWHSDFTNLVGADARIIAMGDPDTVAGGPKTAKLTVVWKTPTLTALEEQPIDANWANWTENWQSGGEALQMGKGFKWKDPPVEDLSKTGVQVVRVFPTAILSITGKVSTVSKSDILKTIGKINSTAVTIKGFPYPTGHLLFEGADISEQQDAYSVTLKWAYKHVATWNKVWRPDTSKWDTPQDGDDNYMYSEADFTTTLDPAGW